MGLSDRIFLELQGSINYLKQFVDALESDLEKERKRCQELNIELSNLRRFYENKPDLQGKFLGDYYEPTDEEGEYVLDERMHLKDIRTQSRDQKIRLIKEFRSECEKEFGKNCSLKFSKDFIEKFIEFVEE